MCVLGVSRVKCGNESYQVMSALISGAITSTIVKSLKTRGVFWKHTVCVCEYACLTVMFLLICMCISHKSLWYLSPSRLRKGFLSNLEPPNSLLLCDSDSIGRGLLMSLVFRNWQWLNYPLVKRELNIRKYFKRRWFRWEIQIQFPQFQ